MTQPEDRIDGTENDTMGDGTDVTIDDAADSADTPASSDPDEMNGDGSLGGTGGENAGGAG